MNKKFKITHLKNTTNMTVNSNGQYITTVYHRRPFLSPNYTKI